ncbi:hypothetical protein L6452_18222 [Arctium lappa]|uniref:Uncharacterized protein n=1 Tax=Arctium lappa TaxID=4217 RepID=A0ACB9C5J8_ARCLA|nr:hypothetical protein L6452_18222 [Arctium lappa]
MHNDYQQNHLIHNKSNTDNHETVEVIAELNRILKEKFHYIQLKLEESFEQERDRFQKEKQELLSQIECLYSTKEENVSVKEKEYFQTEIKKLNSQLASLAADRLKEQLHKAEPQAKPSTLQSKSTHLFENSYPASDTSSCKAFMDSDLSKFDINPSLPSHVDFINEACEPPVKFYKGEYSTSAPQKPSVNNSSKSSKSKSKRRSQKKKKTGRSDTNCRSQCSAKQNNSNQR